MNGGRKLRGTGHQSFTWKMVIKQGYHFSGISGNLEMSWNFAKVREKV